ncbi:uncharacterized protein [Magallana gigas]|uniref:uncharacterized protein n=1 Tax=Magallana gigas TaxID=29159 RepID=UPI003342A6D8
MKRTWMKGHLDRLPGADASTGHWPRLTGNCHQHLQRRRHGNRQQEPPPFHALPVLILADSPICGILRGRQNRYRKFQPLHVQYLQQILTEGAHTKLCSRIQG